MFRHHRKVTALFLLLFVAGAAYYVYLRSGSAVTKGPSETSLAQVTALIGALTGLIGTMSATYLSIRKDRREQEMHARSLASKPEP